MSLASITRERDQLLAALKTSVVAVGFLWGLHLVRLFLFQSPGSWGIVPRRIEGLLGIITAPLAHSGWGHLANNSVPLLATIFLLTYFYPRIASRAMVLMYVLTGISVWFLARGEGWGADITISHVGASGVAYALVSFLFFLGIFKRSMQSIVVALVILFYFSGMIAGVLPDQLNVSWESHLLGGIVGALVAWMFRSSLLDYRVPEPEEVYVDAPYFPADTFAYTKQEREVFRQQALEAERLRRNLEEGDF
ncbi:MAG: rhomboid family intramembrane serine protease [Saprospiraceae bacterium]